MTKYILSIMLLFLSSSVFAQTPEALNYQGVARDGNGAPLTNQAIGLQFSIHESSATGTVVYEETFTVTTSDLGLFALQLGTGTVATGDFSAIDWGANTYFLEVAIDPAGGNTYSSLGASQFVSVPYALRAKSADIDAVNDADADPTNEIQTLSLVGTTLSLTDGGSVVLTDNVNDADADPTNEYLASAVLNGTTLELTDGGGTKTVDLSSLAGSGGPGGSDSIWIAAGGNAYLNPTIGNLGVGITNPAAQFTVGDTGIAAIMLGHAGNFNEVEAGRLIFTEDVLFNGTCGFEFKHNGAANEIRLVSGCTALGDTSIIFTRTGEVKIPERLRIGDQMNPSADLHIKQSSAGNTPGGAGIRFEEPTTTDYWTVWNGGPFLSFGYNGTRMSYIDNTTGSYITTSDLRFKEQIRPVESVLPDVMKLRAVTYHYKSVATADRATGFIAQEVEKVFPELVVTDPTDGVKGISYSEFAVISIKAIQEQQVMIDKQQEEIELLKQAVKALQEAIEK